MKPSDHRMLGRLAAGSILLTFLAAALVVGYALYRSAGHFEEQAVSDAVEEAIATQGR